MSSINLLSFFDVNQTGHGSEVLNRLHQTFYLYLPLRDSLFRRSKREKTSGIQVKPFLPDRADGRLCRLSTFSFGNQKEVLHVDM